jgi:hypothetical protein
VGLGGEADAKGLPETGKVILVVSGHLLHVIEEGSDSVLIVGLVAQMNLPALFLDGLVAFHLLSEHLVFLR